MFNLEFMNWDIIMIYNYQINILLILLFEPSYKTKYTFFKKINSKILWES